MKDRMGVPDGRPLADFLSPLAITAKNLANEITSHKLKEDQSLHGENPITTEHVTSNDNVRETLTKSGIYPEALPPEQDIKKIDRKLKSEEKKLPGAVKKLKP
jgi:DNA-damage-inducible protein D